MHFCNCNPEKPNQKYIKELILFGIVVFQILSFATLMSFPSGLGGDEGPIANSFENYNQNGKWDLTFYKYAPLQGHYHMGRFYLFVLSLIDRLLNISMLTGRLLSFVSGLGVLACFYFICKKVVHDTVLSLMLSLCLSTSGLFVFTSHFTRFEMFALFWFLLSVFFLISAYETDKKRYLILSGLCASVTIEIHIIISISMILSLWVSYLLVFKHKLREKVLNILMCFLLPAAAITTIWVLNRYLSDPSFLGEIIYLKNIVVSSGTYLQQLLASLIAASGYGYACFSNLPDLIFIGFILFASLFLIRGSERKPLLIIVTNLAFFSSFLILGRLNAHYYVYFLPLGFVIAGMILRKVKDKTKLGSVLLILLICLTFVNCSRCAVCFGYALSQDSDFSNYGEQLKARIPDNSTVLVYHNLAPFFGFQFSSTRDLEFAIDLEGMSLEEYIKEYGVEYIIHDFYFEYLLNSEKVNRTNFDNYREKNLELIAEVRDTHFGAYKTRDGTRITEIYGVRS